MKKEINLEEFYNDYLKFANLNDSTETKKTFMAGCTQMYYILTANSLRLNEEEFCNEMSRLSYQILKFWKLEELKNFSKN